MHSVILVEAFCEHSLRLPAVNYFHKKLHLRCLPGFWIFLCSEQVTQNEQEKH